MFYHLLVPFAKEHIFFNVFRYITFRAAMATVTALVLSFVLGPWLVRTLRARQAGGETIRADTPERHRAKAGTPTMGGILILVAVLASTLLWASLKNRYVWMIVLITAGLGFIGLLDDIRKLRTKRGLSTRQKFGAQVLLVAALLLSLYLFPVDGFSTRLAIPFFKGWLVNLRWLWVPFAVPVIMAGGAFAILAYLTGNFFAAAYLKIPNVKGAGELTIFCGALVGASLGFLWFNSYPAQVFMGDVGSLALGGAIGGLAVLTKAELLLPLIGGLYVVEAGSVIIQVVSFKLTGRRVFRMAPLHHHYELAGWAEPKIIVRFWIVSFVLALLALTTLKLR